MHNWKRGDFLEEREQFWELTDLDAVKERGEELVSTVGRNFDDAFEILSRRGVPHPTLEYLEGTFDFVQGRILHCLSEPELDAAKCSHEAASLLRALQHFVRWSFSNPPAGAGVLVRSATRLLERSDRPGWLTSAVSQGTLSLQIVAEDLVRDLAGREWRPRPGFGGSAQREAVCLLGRSPEDRSDLLVASCEELYDLESSRRPSGHRVWCGLEIQKDVGQPLKRCSRRLDIEGFTVEF